MSDEAHIHELRALEWLYNLQRVDYDKVGWRRFDQQVIIKLCPGKLYTQMGGAPLVKVSILHPLVKGRITGSGNTLHEACQRALTEFFRAGIELPLIERP